MRLEKILLITLTCSGLTLSAANIYMATGTLADNVIHLKCDATILHNKTAFIYPNPFSKSTTIYYTPKTNEEITIKLYSSKGIFIDELFHEKVVEGRRYEFILYSEEIEAGVYFCVIENGDKIIHQRIEIID